jgi:hypothetical protein
MQRGIIYKSAQTQEVEEIATLFNVADPSHSRNAKYWQWSNVNTPFGKSISSIAKTENQTIAHYSLMPMKFFVQGDIFLAGFGQQAIVHKKFRNLKIITTLTNKVFEKAKGEFFFLFAFPNDNFFPIYTQLLGWKEIDVFCADVIDIRSFDISIDSDIEIRKIEVFPKIDWFENDKLSIGLQKDSDYLNWRFTGHPTNHYIVFGAFNKDECIGYLVVKVYAKNEDILLGHLIDFDTKGKDEHILSSLLHEGRDFFNLHNIKEIVFWNRDIAFKKFFRKFITGEGFKTNMVILSNQEGLSKILLDKNNWSFTMAISDAF